MFGVDDRAVWGADEAIGEDRDRGDGDGDGIVNRDENDDDEAAPAAADDDDDDTDAKAIGSESSPDWPNLTNKSGGDGLMLVRTKLWAASG